MTNERVTYEALENLLNDKSASKERRIRTLLRYIGVNQGNLGYLYISEAISLALEDRSYIQKITTNLYPAIAKKFNTMPSRVERAIRHEIENLFYEGISKKEMQVKADVFGVVAERNKFTNREFIASLTNFIEEFEM